MLLCTWFMRKKEESLLWTIPEIQISCSSRFVLYNFFQAGEVFFTHFIPFQPSGTFYIETSQMICSSNPVNGFYMKCNTWLKWVKVQIVIHHVWLGKVQFRRNKHFVSIWNNFSFSGINLIDRIFIIRKFISWLISIGFYSPLIVRLNYAMVYNQLLN